MDMIIDFEVFPEDQSLQVSVVFLKMKQKGTRSSICDMNHAAS